MPLRRYALLALAAIAFSGCVTLPSSQSFEKSRQQLLTDLASKSPCCTALKDVPRKDIPSSGEWHELIDEANPVVAFDQYRSYVLLLRLPPGSGGKSLGLTSKGTTSWTSTGGFFSPVVSFFDTDFKLLKTVREFRYDADEKSALQDAGIKGQVQIPSSAKYLLLFTSPEELAKESVYRWNGARAYNIDSYAPRVAASANYAGRVDVVIKPHLPVGRVRFAWQ